jgi:hypothetical protein
MFARLAAVGLCLVVARARACDVHGGWVVQTDVFTNVGIWAQQARTLSFSKPGFEFVGLFVCTVFTARQGHTLLPPALRLCPCDCV